MKKNFVTFFSPGTFFSEETTKEIDEWNVDLAMEMAKDIYERYDAKPYGFKFYTRERNENDFDSKETNRSGLFYLGGKVFTVKELEDKNDPEDSILIMNMKGNGYDRCVVNTNSWKFTGMLSDGDTVLDFNMR